MTCFDKLLNDKITLWPLHCYTMGDSINLPIPSILNCKNSLSYLKVIDIAYKTWSSDQDAGCVIDQIDMHLCDFTEEGESSTQTIHKGRTKKTLSIYKINVCCERNKGVKIKAS